jgi:sugar phosphate isomerase/epimerase
MSAAPSSYAADRCDPSPYLERLAQAGFTHVHWTNHWDSDFLYSSHEIAQIKRWLEADGLALQELVENRLRMTAELGGDAIVMHLPYLVDVVAEQWDQVRRSLDDLQPTVEATGVRIALENYVTNRPEDWDGLERVIGWYPEATVGFCLDVGHAHIGPFDGLARSRDLIQRLIVVHLHDNDGTGDQHLIPFDGTMPWETVADLIVSSPYVKPLTLEVTMRPTTYPDEDAFLRQSAAAAAKLEAMLAAQRG